MELVFVLLLFVSCNFYVHADDAQCHCITDSQIDLELARKDCAKFIEDVRDKSLVPGMAVGVSRKGSPLWVQAFGLSDVENEVKARTDTVWRVASVSKSLTSALVGHLIERGLIDLNRSIHDYLDEKVFPVKQWNGQNVTITVGQLMSHTAGLRVTEFPSDFEQVYNFGNATQTLSQFKDRPLLSAPGTQFNYSNYGFQVLGAVIESVLNRTYESAINDLFKQLGMGSTLCERHDLLIPHRARYYMRSDSTYLNESERTHDQKDRHLRPAFLWDDIWPTNSWHTAGGIVSTVGDLLTFGHYMIDSFKGTDGSLASGLPYLKTETMKKLWEPVILAWPGYSHTAWGGTSFYTHAWAQLTLDKSIVCEGKCRMPTIKQFYYHFGEQDGIQTILLLLPDHEMVVTVLANSNPIEQIMELAVKLAKSFIE